MEKSFGLLFFLKKPSGYQQGPLLVYVHITVDGTARGLNTKRLVALEKWNQAAGRGSGKSEEMKELNAYLDSVQGKVFAARRKLLERDEEITAEKIKNLVLGKNPNKPKHLLLEIFRHLLLHRCRDFY